MALFSRKKSTDAKAEVAENGAKKSKVSTAPLIDRNLESVIVKPRITEKAVGKSEQNVYTFVVARTATKYDVRDAVKAIFGVTPVKVNIVNKTPRQFMSRVKSRTITETGMKKAYVYLKKGDTIDLA